MQKDAAKDTAGTAGDSRGGEYARIGDNMPLWQKAANILALTLVLSFSVLFVVVMSSLPRVDGRHPISGIGLRTLVARDGMGVPKITAETPHDAYFAMGWVHAQDRMWQMETQRRLGAGRLAEMVGEAGLASDRYMRTLGLYRAAERSLDSLSEPTRQALNSYAEGVNAWMTHNRLRLPPEYVLLGVRPEPWTPADSVVWQKIMAMTLTANWRDDVLRAQLGRILEPKRILELFPGYPADAPVTLSPDGGKAMLDAVPAAMTPTAASNLWVVSGARTLSGKPLLAGDPHLGFRAPILWYLAEVEAPGLRLSGATVPGLPFHLIGHNGRVAWTFTATQADTVDLFMEKTVDSASYRASDGIKPFAVRTEIIKVRGGDDVTLTVRETRHGPVVSDVAVRDVGGPGEVAAMAATALSPNDTGVQALYELNLTKDWPGFLAAAGRLQAPVLNIAYADTTGNIGFVTAGRVPLRKSGNGTVPQRGWTGEGDWTGWIPTAKMPSSYNPKSGLLVNANNKVVGDKYPYLLTAQWPEGYRAARIRALLGERRGLTPEDMEAMQMDSVSLQAVELKDLLTGADFKGERERNVARRIAEWDGRQDRDRAEPLIFAAWMNRFNRAVLADELREVFPAFERVRPQVLMDVLTHRRHWCDDVATQEAESCDDLIERSLVAALDDLEKTWGKDMKAWRWGAAHPARFEHAVLSRVPLLRSKGVLEVPADGDDFTVNRASYEPDATGTRFPQVHGAGLRAVFDLGDLSNSRFVIATGQSGNPLSRNYDDMLAAWSVNRTFLPAREPRRSVLVLERGG